MRLRRRISRTNGGQTVQFLYDGSNTVQELSGGTATANMLVGAALDESWSRTDALGARLTLADGLGSTTALTDLAGVTQTQYTYEPFGKTQASGSASVSASQFTGRENDAPASDLYFYRARYFSPSAQRFMSEDPIEFEGGINLYAYAHNDPIDFIDPD